VFVETPSVWRFVSSLTAPLQVLSQPLAGEAVNMSVRHAGIPQREVVSPSLNLSIDFIYQYCYRRKTLLMAGQLPYRITFAM